MIKRILGPIFCIGIFIACSCSRERAAINPMAYAPSQPSAVWTPLKKNILLSSKYCETLLPPSFTENGTALSLAELIDIGLQNSPGTKMTWSEARSSAAQYGQSLSAYYPELNATTTYSRVRQSFFDIIDVFPYYLTTVTPELTLTYTIFDFGQRRSSSESARQALFYADWTHNQEIQTVIQMVMDDYYDYTYQKQLQIALAEDLENSKTTLEAAEQKLHWGVASLGDVAQAKSSYLQAKINFISQERSVENSFATLAKDVGLPANLYFTVQNLPEKVCADIVLDGVDELIQKAQQCRQDLMAAQADVCSKKALVDQAKAVSLPLIQGEFDFGKNWWSGGLKEDYHFTMQFTMTFPLFKGFYYKNGVRGAKANLEKSTAMLLDKELSIIKEVATSHQNVKSSSETLKYSEEYVETAALQYAIALANYKAGTGTILDVLNAQTSLADARSKLANSKKDWFSSLASLAYSTGSLCPVPEQCYGKRTNCL